MKFAQIMAAALVISATASIASASRVTEFCLDGELDLGARYQGMTPQSGEFYPTTWCVITEDESSRVLFSGSGKSNPDMEGSWTVAYLPPDTVRIVNREAPPDIEFHGTDNLDEALRVRRIDPRRLLQEFHASENTIKDTEIEVCDDRVVAAKMSADLPLRGHVNVEWQWAWANADKPSLELMLDNELLFKATGRWRVIPENEATGLWSATTGSAPIEVPGDRWPAKVDMQLTKVTDDIYIVGGVRTGFQHIVVDTNKGLVVADAPAGWVEFHHIPPSDLVPGLGVSGLSEKLVDFLKEQLPTRPIYAVALTHFHDDHSGGARAFAAAGARIFASTQSADFFTAALNRRSMPDDRQTRRKAPVVVEPVSKPVLLGRRPNRVKLLPMGPGPHANAMLGVWAMDKDYFFVSDVHVPRSDADVPASHRVLTECWFAAWAVKNLPQDVQVANSHSAPLTPVSRLKKYLSSDSCKQ